MFRSYASRADLLSVVNGGADCSALLLHALLALALPGGCLGTAASLLLLLFPRAL